MIAQELLPKTGDPSALLAKVDGLLDDARNGREKLYSTYVEIGVALLEVEEARAWSAGGFHSFEAYLKHCEVRFGRTRTSLYGYRSVAKNLLPSVSKEQLTEIGISRAFPLAQYVKRTGKPASDFLPDALNPKIGIEEFEGKIADATHMKGEKGKWHQISIKAEDEEWAEIERAMALALDLEPLKPETSEPTRRKVALLRMSAEFLATYESEVNTVNGLL